MIRWITQEDKKILDQSLEKDIYHKDTDSNFFYTPGSFCTVYEDSIGPVMFVRAAKALRIDVQFYDNQNYIRNRQALIENFAVTAKQAKDAGFSELVFNTTSPLLKRFCKQTLGFQDIPGDELRFIL